MIERYWILSQRPLLLPNLSRRGRSRRLSTQMYDRVLADDVSFNDHFFFGVTSTGIYCLPSCRLEAALSNAKRTTERQEETRVKVINPLALQSVKFGNFRGS
jgi:hypothetical protein